MWVRLVSKKASGAGAGRGRVGGDIPPTDVLPDDYILESVLPLLKMEGDRRLSYDQQMAALDAVTHNIKMMRLRLGRQAIGDVTRLPRPARMKRTRCGRNRRRRPTFVKPT
jgi:hypothetical protein